MSMFISPSLRHGRAKAFVEALENRALFAGTPVQIYGNEFITGLAEDGSNNLYAVVGSPDANASDLIKIAANTHVATKLFTLPFAAKNLATDSLGNLYGTDKRAKIFELPAGKTSINDVRYFDTNAARVPADSNSIQLIVDPANNVYTLTYYYEQNGGQDTIVTKLSANHVLSSIYNPLVDGNSNVDLIGQIAADKAGNVFGHYSYDNGDGKVHDNLFVINAGAHTKTTLAPLPAYLSTSIAVDANDTVYAGYWFNTGLTDGGVLKYTAAGGLTKIATLSTLGNSITLDPSGSTIYGANYDDYSKGGSLFKITTSNNQLTTLATFGQNDQPPTTIIFDAAGLLHGIEGLGEGNNVYEYDPAPSGSIMGVTFNDDNGNGVQDQGEAPGGGKTIYLDANNNGVLDRGELSYVTGADGAFVFRGLPPATYHIRRVFPSGYSQSTANLDVNLFKGASVAGLQIGSKPINVMPPPASTASVQGFTFNDTNANGVQDNGEARGSGKTIFLDTNNNGLLDNGEKSIASDANGEFKFAGLAAGTYHVRTVFPAGYTYSTALIDVTVTAGQMVGGLQIGRKSGSTPPPPPPPSKGTLSGHSYDDANKNGVFDRGETLTSGKTIFLDTNNNGKLDSGETSVVSGADGVFTFGNLSAGTYHVRRVFPYGYTYSNAPIDVTLNAGQTIDNLYIGSKPF